MLFYLSLDDLKRSDQRHIFSMGCISKTVQEKHIVTIKHGECWVDYNLIYACIELVVSYPVLV